MNLDELHSVGAAAAKALLVVPQRGSLAPLQTSSWLSVVPSNGLRSQWERANLSHQKSHPADDESRVVYVVKIQTH